MTYQEAVKEMEVLNQGRYAYLSHRTFSDGQVMIEVYIARDGRGHANPSNTYAGAIENAKAMLGLTGSDPAPEDEIPVLKPITTQVREFKPETLAEFGLEDR